jgi:catechol 2,3-dioxygenase-like lactoylglutathione lyase family enzyme
MPAFTFDHIALPCFDVVGTQRFYTEILECPLVYAQIGSAQAWNSHEFLLLAYRLPDGTVLDFFSYDGIRRPADDGLPKDIRHVAIAMAGRDEVAAYERRLKEASISFWTERHGVDDPHLYVTDPNGVVLEILAQEDGARRRSPDREGAQRTLDRWLAVRKT